MAAEGKQCVPLSRCSLSAVPRAVLTPLLLVAPRSRATLLTRVRFSNPLPPVSRTVDSQLPPLGPELTLLAPVQPPFPPRLLNVPTTPQRYAAYDFLTPIQGERELPLILDAELGLPLEYGRPAEGADPDGEYWMGNRSCALSLSPCSPSGATADPGQRPCSHRTPKRRAGPSSSRRGRLPLRRADPAQRDRRRPRRRTGHARPRQHHRREQEGRRQLAAQDRVPVERRRAVEARHAAAQRVRPLSLSLPFSLLGSSKTADSVSPASLLLVIAQYRPRPPAAPRKRLTSRSTLKTVPGAPPPSPPRLRPPTCPCPSCGTRPSRASRPSRRTTSCPTPTCGPTSSTSCGSARTRQSRDRCVAASRSSPRLLAATASSYRALMLVVVFRARRTSSPASVPTLDCLGPSCATCRPSSPTARAASPTTSPRTTRTPSPTPRSGTPARRLGPTRCVAQAVLSVLAAPLLSREAPC